METYLPSFREVHQWKDRKKVDQSNLFFRGISSRELRTARRAGFPYCRAMAWSASLDLGTRSSQCRKAR